MTQQALGAGASIPRKRVMFGLLDADGWGWASVKAFLWMLIIIFMLGYLPDRAYYFTVGRTVELGVLVWAPINACPPTNETLPCPPPTGAVIPWQPSPEELRLPAPRTGGSIIQNGTTLLYIGGSDGAKAVDTVYVSQVVGTGNFDKWTEGPTLPEPRSGASVAFVSGSIYVIGGRDGAGVPTDTIFVMNPDPKTGELKPWTTSDVKLPEGRADAAGVVSPTGLLLIGGSNAAGPVNTTWKSEPTGAGGTLGEWTVEAPLVFPQTNANAAVIGDYVWLYGGSDANGPVGAVQRAEFGRPAIEGLPDNPDEGKVIRWAVNNDANLPEPRTEASGWSANGAIYLVGGEDASGAPQSQLYWAIPTTEGEIPEWKHLDVSDLPPSGLAGAAPVDPRPGCGARRRHDRYRRAHVERPRQHRPAVPVLLARHPGRHHPGTQAGRRDRPAAGVHRCGDRRDGQLRPARGHRLHVRPQGPDRGVLPPPAEPPPQVVLT